MAPHFWFFASSDTARTHTDAASRAGLKCGGIGDTHTYLYTRSEKREKMRYKYDVRGQKSGSFYCRYGQLQYGVGHDEQRRYEEM